MAESTNGNGAAKVELPENERPKDEQANIASEFTALGKKFAEAMGTAWNSQERQNIQKEITEGINRLADEVNKAANKARETEVAQRVETGVKQVGDDFKSGKVKDDMRQGMIKALRGLGDAVDKMADSFTDPEEAPKE